MNISNTLEAFLIIWLFLRKNTYTIHETVQLSFCSVSVLTQMVFNNQKQKTFVKCGIRTHAHISGPEYSIWGRV